MPKDGSKTKTKILDVTTQLVLKNGFNGTAIDHILEETQITKGAFFYHFKSKADLAYHLMRYFADQDLALMEKVLNQTSSEEERPVKRLLSFVSWFIDEFKDLEEPYAGCLYASYLHESEQFDDEIKGIVSEAIFMWRKELSVLLNEAKAEVPNHAPFDVDSLADHFTVIMEGAFVVSKAINDPKLTALHLTHYKNYLELIFRLS